MNFLNNLSHFVQGYIWATVLFPVEYYLAKPIALRIYQDVIYYTNPVTSKLFNKTAPNNG